MNIAAQAPVIDRLAQARAAKTAKRLAGITVRKAPPRASRYNRLSDGKRLAVAIWKDGDAFGDCSATTRSLRGRDARRGVSPAGRGSRAGRACGG